MLYYQLFLTLLAFLLPTHVLSQCTACDSYTAALKSCDSTSANVATVGGVTDTAAIHCMCTAQSNTTQINACDGCWNSNPNLDLDIAVLLAWLNTCKADDQFGEQQAVWCWEGQPGNSLPCFMKNAGGSEMTPTATSLPKSPSASMTPSSSGETNSSGVASFRSSELLSIAIFALGMVIVL